VLLRGRTDPVQGRPVGRRGQVAGYPEIVAEVARSDEQHVHPVDRGDLVGLLDGAGGLDLDHAEDVGPVERADVQAEPAGAVVGGDAAVAVRRVPQVPDRRFHLGLQIFLDGLERRLTARAGLAAVG